MYITQSGEFDLYSIPEQVVEESSGELADRVSELQHSHIRQWSTGGIETTQSLF